jgi:glycosyltransferase involved in cell wall biosynthesis
MATPLVSVLMTANNREKYIAEAIESVLASSFKHFELIVVDDCSTDNTVEIARRYISDRRVQLHLNEKNLGDYPNRNRAASYAKGKYLKYVDADDYIYPRGLESMVEMMERFPEAGLGIGCPSQDNERPYPFQLSPSEAYRRHYFLRCPIFGRSPLSVIIRRDAFEQAGYFSGKRFTGDFEMWHVLAARHPVLLMPGGTAWYRIHGEQETVERRSDPRLEFSYLIVAREQLMKPRCPLSTKEKSKALQKVRQGQARAVLRAVGELQLRNSWDMFQQSGFSMPLLLKAAFTR